MLLDIIPKQYYIIFPGGYSVRVFVKVRKSNENILIENAKEQERAGIRPAFAWMDPKTGEALTPPGWLVWSTLDGCGVVYRRKKDGKYIINTGTQGDFVCV